MSRDIVVSMVRALPEVKEDGSVFTFGTGWEITLHAGISGAPMNVQQVTSIKVENEFLTVETRKGQRVALIVREVRGLTADPSSNERKGNRPGFV